MRKIFESCLLGILLAFYSVGLTTFAADGDGQHVGLIKVCGTALNLGGESIAKENAIKDAKIKAVSKVTARFVAPTPGKDSLYQRIVANYDKYIAGDIKVVKKEKISGKYLLYCNVPVNGTLIDADLKKIVSAVQNSEAHELDEAVFLVRLSGLNKGDDVGKLPVSVLNDYAHAFAEFGFKVKGNDLTGNALHSMLAVVNAVGQNTPNYMDYRNVMLKSLREDMVDVTLAVLGEIKLAKVTEMADGVYAEADCIVESIGIGGEGIHVVGEYTEKFNATRPNRREAIAVVVKKAAVNTSKNLANVTLNYWKQNRQK